MPLYEYECDTCGHRVEVIQKYVDAPPAACPKCGGPVHKLFSSPAIQFKGSGFYITDYARAGKSEDTSGAGKAEKAEKADKADRAEKASASSEATSDSKGDNAGGSKGETKATETKTPETKTTDARTDSKPSSSTSS